MNFSAVYQSAIYFLLLSLHICLTMKQWNGELELRDEPSIRRLAIVLPSRDVLEEVGIRFLEALIKRSQIEMTKSVLKTQLGTLRRLHPAQYKRLKLMPVQRLATQAVMQQVKSSAQSQIKTGNRLIDMLQENGIPIGTSIRGIEQALNAKRLIDEASSAEQYKRLKLMPVQRLATQAVMQQVKSSAQSQIKTGNRLIDMLQENGIPIGTSIRGIEQALNAKRLIDEASSAEQIGNAVLEKFQKEILPNLIANIIAGRNPFRVMSEEQVKRTNTIAGLPSTQLRQFSSYDYDYEQRIQQIPKSHWARYTTDQSFIQENAQTDESVKMNNGYFMQQYIPKTIVKRLRNSPQLYAAFNELLVAATTAARFAILRGHQLVV
ncbi:hypothetical protein Tcan_08809 [Toxocara canis]|uniref:Uncharacterized protein n=1 Tax=Toxocara canis TaxID=6265 RepID=A0A0B2URD8_TOXCA|nr:hypothetical protein Tcan_08809 [Toxocara canis]